MSLMSSGPLFQYKSYFEQDALKLTEAETEAIVEVVSGLKAAENDIKKESIWGSTDNGNGIEGFWIPEGRSSKSLGEVFMIILNI